MQEMEEGEESSELLFTRHGQCTHELNAVMAVCTRSSQQDQSIFQQAALIGLSGLQNKNEEGMKVKGGVLEKCQGE